jgi:hypothetical protein
LQRLARLALKWREVPATDDVRVTAERLLRVHALRGADALQLAAAMSAADGRPSTLEFVCLDRRLVETAAREGFQILDLSGS